MSIISQRNILIGVMSSGEKNEYMGEENVSISEF